MTDNGIYVEQKKFVKEIVKVTFQKNNIAAIQVLPSCWPSWKNTL